MRKKTTICGTIGFLSDFLHLYQLNLKKWNWTYCGDPNYKLSTLFLHIHHHSMATFITDEVSDSIPCYQLFCFWLSGGLGAGGRQGAGNHRFESRERGKDTAVFGTGEECFTLVGPGSIPLPLVFSLGGEKHSSTPPLMSLTLSTQYLY